MHTSMITLQQLLRLTFAGSVKWLNEKPKDNIPIRWVVISINEIEPGDVLLLPVSELDPALVKQVKQRGGVAIIVWGKDNYAGSFDPGLPVVAIPEVQDYRNINRVMLTILINQRAYLMERGVRIHAQLSQLEAEGVGIMGLAKAMSEISGRGVLIQDKRLQILADSPSSTLHSIWEDILHQLEDLNNLPKELINRKQAGRSVTIIKQPIPGGITRSVIPIVVGGVARGYLSLVGLDGEFDELDNLVMEQGALVCGIDMARAKAVREAEKRLKGNLLSAVLSEDLTPRDTHLWVQNMGLDLDQAQTIMRFSWDGDSPPSLRRLETLINGDVAKHGAKVILEAVGSEVVCVCQLEEGALRLARSILEQAAEEFPDNPARCGIGTPVHELSQWRDSFRQAGQALALARRLNQRKPMFFPDLSVYRLLLQLEFHPELQMFKQEILGNLLVHDGVKESLRTLEAYFENNGNLSQAAEALFIHRNTLLYRMDRIAEISGLDLDHPETRLAVQLALRIHRMLERESIEG